MSLVTLQARALHYRALSVQARRETLDVPNDGPHRQEELIPREDLLNILREALFVAAAEDTGQ